MVDAMQALAKLQNCPNCMDGLELLGKIPGQIARIAFFDPQYRGILDKMAYGNEGKKRGKDRSALPQMDDKLIQNFIFELNRILLTDGYLFLWLDKFHLMEGIKAWLPPELAVVDMITWDKRKMGMGYRSRRICEYLAIIQKAPRHAKSTWLIHDIPDVWAEKLALKTHPHAKPPQLLAKLILATTRPGDLVVDPASGSFSVLSACQETGRNFLGCDLVYGKTP